MEPQEAPAVRPESDVAKLTLSGEANASDNALSLSKQPAGDGREPCKRKGCQNAARPRGHFCSTACRCRAHDHPEDDLRRTGRRVDAILGVMASGEWLTVREIARAVGCLESSAGARLRDLRKSRYGGFAVETRRRAGTRELEYHVVLRASRATA